jgi:sugar phosphate isomerase/epimerase
MLDIGIQTIGLKQPVRQALQTAARLGARGVEVDLRRELPAAEMSATAVRQFRKTLEDLGLKMSAVGFPTRRGYNVVEGLDRRVAATKRAMQLAYSLGAPVVINQVGRIPEDEDDREFTLLVEVLSELGEHGQRVGALLAAETGAEDGEQLGKLVAALPGGSLAVNFNPGNLITNGFSPLDAIAALGPHIMHIHAKDGVRDLARGRGSDVPLGRGSVDFPALLAALEDYQYRGFLTIERDAAEDPVAEFARAVQFLKNVQMN